MMRNSLLEGSEVKVVVFTDELTIESDFLEEGPLLILVFGFKLRQKHLQMISKVLRRHGLEYDLRKSQVKIQKFLGLWVLNKRKLKDFLGQQVILFRLQVSQVKSWPIKDFFEAVSIAQTMRQQDDRRVFNATKFQIVTDESVS